MKRTGIISYCNPNATTPHKIGCQCYHCKQERSEEGENIMYVYIHSETNQYGNWLYTVGFYSPDGKWNPESDHDTKESAAERVHYLNGGR